LDARNPGVNKGQLELSHRIDATIVFGCYFGASLSKSFAGLDGVSERVPDHFRVASQIALASHNEHCRSLDWIEDIPQCRFSTRS
jgi:hypothetical protein